MTEQTIAIHQQVREFVQAYLEERDMPYIVTQIECTSRTRYMPTLETRNDLIPEYILADVHMSFRVEAESPRGGMGIRCDVHASESKLHMDNVDVWQHSRMR
jgi:hypothetical protein